MDQSMATVEVLQEIKEAVGDKLKLIIDGGIRHGEDVYKMLALGADACLIGRPYIIVAEGMEARGVELYTQKIMVILQEMKRTMAVWRSAAEVRNRWKEMQQLLKFQETAA